MDDRDGFLEIAAVTAAQAANIQRRPVGVITGREGQYQVVGDRLAVSARFSLYHVQLSADQYGVLKIAATPSCNTSLDKEAYLLKEMHRAAKEIDAATGKSLNYQYFFPEVVESFIAQSQHGRRVTVMRFAPLVKDFTQFVPLARIVQQERLRVDPMTAGWVMGRALRLLAFAHENCQITNGMVAGTNYLLEREFHGAILFDWTQGMAYPDGVPVDVASREIACAARLAIMLLGGDSKTGVLPTSDQLPDDRYERFLRHLALEEEADAGKAYDQYYELLDSQWQHHFHPWTTSPL